MELKEKSCLVTGSSRGFGKAVALKLASLGANVAVNYFSDSSKKEAQETVNAVRDLAVKSFAVRADVSKAKEARELVARTASEFGGLDVLVNNAGVFPRNPGTPTTELAEEEWDWLIGTNLKGVFLCTKFAVKEMLKQGNGGRVVNISSVAGLIGSKSGCHYAASKSGVIGLTYSWAEEFAADGILVNAVAPGPVRTRLLENVSKERMQRFTDDTPTKRLATVEDIADAVAFLATAESVNGQVLVVDGGRVKR